MNAVLQPSSNEAPTTAKIRLSVCIITQNAAAQLGPCIDSVAFADEILVVDSGSSDETVALSRSMGARVIEHEWLGFGKQKQFAVEAAANDWVLCLDADERVSGALATSIAEALNSDKRHVVYSMARRNCFLGRWLAHGEGYPDWSTRLFDRRFAHWSDDPVHETVTSNTRERRLEGDLLHESAEDISTYLDKQNRYSSLHAKLLFEQGIRVGYVKLWLSPLIRFLKFYILRGGFLDGGPGFAHIAIGCYTAFAKYAKLIELQNEASPGR